jgi:DNA-binding MarR family transcriptional regulator
VNASSDDGLKDGTDGDRDIEIDVIDALLPSRKFTITYKIAELGKLSLTSEFFLRLIHSVEGLSQAEAAAFFGFSESETSFVIGELEAAGFIDRRDGRLRLTLAGRELFKPGSETPEVYEVEQRTERHGFDLIALAPAEFYSLSRFESALPELPSNADEVAHASKSVPSAFRRHFNALVRRVSDTPLKQSLYAVDNVTALRRYAVPVSIRVRAKAELPGIVEPDLSDRWSGFELDDREKVVSASAAYLKANRITAGPFDDLGFNELLRIAPDSLEGYSKGAAFKREQFYRDANRRVGELRSDRRTVLFVGSVFTDRNVARLNRALEYSGADELEDESPYFLWHAPAVATWGASRRLPQVLEAISQHRRESDGAEPIVPVGVLQEGHPWFVDRAFGYVVTSYAPVLKLAALELLLIPRRVVAVMVHVPAIGSTESYPVPLGILSFDKDVVRRATMLMQQLVLPTTVVASIDAREEFVAKLEQTLRV